jgi:hypothetical protein
MELKQKLQVELLHCLEINLNTQWKQKKIKYFIGKKVFKNMIWQSSPLDGSKYCNCEAINLP